MTVYSPHAMAEWTTAMVAPLDWYDDDHHAIVVPRCCEARTAVEITLTAIQDEYHESDYLDCREIAGVVVMGMLSR